MTDIFWLNVLPWTPKTCGDYSEDRQWGKGMSGFFFLIKFEAIDGEVAQQMNVTATQTMWSEFSSTIHGDGK